MRSKFALIAAAGLIAVGLAACSSSAAPQASAGGSSNAVVVKGGFDTTPEISFPAPLQPKTTECTELIRGKGDALQTGQSVLAGIALYNGKTGDKIQVTGFDGEKGAVLSVADTKTHPDANAGIVGVAKALTCARQGSRVVAVIPNSQVGQIASQLGLGPDASLVFVADIQRAFPAKSDGTPRLTRDDFPAVVLAPDGTPGITVPKTNPPKSTEVEVLKEGSGAVVKDGAQVLVHYTGVLWQDGKVPFDSTWDKGAPANFVVSLKQGSGQVIPGFSKAIVGQKVGSQIGVIVTPQDGYGAQGAPPKVPGNATLFFVVDILGVL